ncbi:hypothetical protein BX661DRAFT_179644 [Kickxella alabastrina]|uniref:uncharacterized protein n=1 Tax=Kickxella alabastrina TaxID=61397 RepID=UPI00221F33D8|nr:uncharacterized protein BX661DRAFT_179644 [Kickxella alabastrina]KAI7832008.1 hypothetical protein BX661DRAFT_179644 [Kickxella alabastrina]
MDDPSETGLSTAAAKEKLLRLLDTDRAKITVPGHFNTRSAPLVVLLGTTLLVIAMLVVNGAYLLAKGSPKQHRGTASLVEAGLLFLSVLFTACVIRRESHLESMELEARLQAIAREIRAWTGTYAQLRTPQLATGDALALAYGEVAPCLCTGPGFQLERGQRLHRLWAGTGSARTEVKAQETPLRRHLAQMARHQRPAARSVLQNQLARVIRLCTRSLLPALAFLALLGNAIVYGVRNGRQLGQVGTVVEILVGRTAYTLFPFACSALWPVFWVAGRIFASACGVRSKTEYEDTDDIDEFDVEALPPTKDIQVELCAIFARMRWLWTHTDYRNLSRSSNLAETLGSITVISSIDKEGTVAEPRCGPEQIVVPESNDYAVLDLAEQIVGAEKRTLIADDGWQKYLPGLRALGLACALQQPRERRRLGRLRALGAVMPAQDVALRPIGAAIGFSADDLGRFTVEAEAAVFSRRVRCGGTAASFTAILVAGGGSGGAGSGRQVLSHGCAELVLGACTDYFDGAAIRRLDDETMGMYYALCQNALKQDLQCLAFAYRPAADIEEPLQGFIALDDGATQPGEANTHDLPVHLTEAMRRSFACPQLAQQILLGLVTFAYDPKTDVCDFIEDLSIAGIRFVHFSSASGRQAKAFGERLGLETDWNTCILLSSGDANDGDGDASNGSARSDTSRGSDTNGDDGGGGYVEEYDIKARLPRGIDQIRPHLAEVDDIPLQISLFAECTAATTREMVRVFQENGDVACVIGSALADANTLTFAAADLAVGVEPVPQFNGGEPQAGNDGSISTAGALSTQFALGAALTCIPCPLFLQHETSLYTLLQVVSEARRLTASLSLGAILLGGSALAASVINLVSALCLLPPAMGGVMLLWVLWVAVPLLAAALLFAPHDEATMSTMPVKNHAHVADMPRFAAYAVLPLNALLPDARTRDWMHLNAEDQAAVWAAQALATAGFVFHCVCISASLMHRTRYLDIRSLRNAAWVGAVVVVLALTFGAAAAVVAADACKMHDRKRWTRLQKLAKIEFNTKLGLHSPL